MMKKNWLLLPAMSTVLAAFAIHPDSIWGQYGSGGYAGGMIGSDMGGMGGPGMGSMGPQDSASPLVVELRGKLEKSTRHRVYSYVPDTFRITPVNFAQSGMYGGGDMNGSGDMYGGMMAGGSSGGMGYGGMGEMYGGGGMSGGMSPGMPGDGSSPPTPLLLYALIFDGQFVNGRVRVEVVTVHNHSNQSASIAGGSEGGFGSLGESGGEGGGGSGSGMGAASPLKAIPLRDYVDTKDQALKRFRLTEVEIDLMIRMINQVIWKDEVVKRLNLLQGKSDVPADLEKQLREILSEEYDTQLNRQELAAKSIENRLTTLREEIGRRRKAKDRVMDIRVGNMILKAEGLLENAK